MSRNVQTPDSIRVLVDRNIVGHCALDQVNGDHRVVLRRREVAQNTHVVRGAALTVAILHFTDKILAHTRAIHAGHVHRVPLTLQAVVRLVKQTAVTCRVAGEDRRGAVARHRSRSTLKHSFWDTAGLVRDQQYVRAVNTSESLWLLGA